MPTRACRVELLGVLTEDGGGTLVPIFAQPRASRTGLGGVHAGALKVALAAPPVDGKANRALVAWLARELGVPRGSVALIRGASGRRKRVRIDGLTPAEVADRLAS